MWPRPRVWIVVAVLKSNRFTVFVKRRLPRPSKVGLIAAAVPMLPSSAFGMMRLAPLEPILAALFCVPPAPKVMVPVPNGPLMMVGLLAGPV